jgi:NAD(P)-dependent dehydrogenase (short-subunit alcohol dehydrogenase family)
MVRWMMSALVTGAAMAVGLALALALPAENVIVTLDHPPRDLQTGVPFSLGFTVHGAAAAKPLVTARNAAGEAVVVAAQPEKEPGHFVALLILPSAGQWEWDIRPFGVEGAPVAMSPLQVTDPGAAPATPEAIGFWLMMGAVLLAPLGVLIWAVFSGSRLAPEAADQA